MARLIRTLICLAAAMAASPLPAPAQGPRTDVLDVKRLPLGDGRVSAAPQRGSVYSCQTRFGGRGAFGTGSWVRGDTWDSTGKLSVRGEVDWPDARFEVAVRGDERIVAGNGLPVGTRTGTFPVARDDPAFQVDRNPNTIRARDVRMVLPRVPQMAAQPSCVSLGPIGVTTNGVAIFNALDDMGRDAVAHEVQDACGGHPEMAGRYHYHGPSPCLPHQTANEALVGYAIDGFGIYGIYDADGRELTNADLDECHGRIGEVMWDGRRVSMYHYVLTREYPYTVGCFRGTPIAVRQGPPPGGPRRPPPGPPPGMPGGGPPPFGPPMR